MKLGLILKSATAILIHFLFWIGVYFFYTYFLGYGSTNTGYVNRYVLFLMPVTVITSYVFYFYLIPEYLLKNKRGLFLLYTVYTFILSSFLAITSILYGYFLLHNYHNESTTPLTKTILFIYLSIYFVVFVMISISLIINNKKIFNKNHSIESLHKTFQ